MPVSKSVAYERGRVAGLTRAVRNGERRADDPSIDDARRNLRAAKAAAYIDRILSEAPPLTDEQRVRLAELMRPARKAGAK